MSVGGIATAVSKTALSAAEPVAWINQQELRYLEMVSGNNGWGNHLRSVTLGGEEEGRSPLYAKPPAPSLAVKALDFDTVYVIPREMTDEEWAEVKYNVDRKANPDIDLWRIKEAVKYANFIAGHRGRSALSAQVQETNCAKCGLKKHTPLRVDRMGGYVCLTCIDIALSAQVQDVAGWQLVPVEPTAEMEDAARHLMMWLDFARPTEAALIAHCKRLGKEPPPECRDVDHVPPKAMRLFWVYRAMLAAAPAKQEATDVTSQ
ncbi:hypothetical protein [Agrobacterium sp. El2ro-1b]|uniref:hypothetical protein n=1 Tax=Agrobacterium sp. El2ro-1b TaxID=2969528 RepID=UPI003AAAF170